VLADVFMPVRNGYEVCEFVKKDPRFSHIPVILLVGAFDPLDEKEARRVGADGVLKKPFVPPDPLIAMVMSALEKNPKVAAELAKAKEVIAAPPPPIEVLEAPLRSEPKPLPEYPEPTPEEAAAIYGFGKGVRALAGDVDEEEEEEEKETRKSRKSKSANVPKTPVASVADDDDDFDNAATTSDWRRNTADFEVPENVAQDLPIDAVDPSIFPSEKDVPPRRVREDEQSEDEAAAPPANAHSWADAVHQSEPQQKAAEEAPAGIFGETASVESTPDVPRATWLSESDDAPVEAAAQKPAPKQTSSQESSHVSHDRPKHDTRQEPAVLPRATEWMDMMAPPPSEYPDGGWMSNLPAPRAETSAAQAEEKATQTSHVETAPNAEETAAAEIAQAREHAQEVESQANPNKRVFSDAPAFGGSSYHFASEARESDSVAEDAAHVPASSDTRDSEHELMVAPADAGRRQKDNSWHAASEPLLVDEEHSQPADYAPAQDPPPPAEEHAAVSDPAPPTHLQPSVFDPAHPEPVFEEFRERIPTLPPPNREALSQIPFLMPPPPEPPKPTGAFDEAEPEATDSKVEDVVRRVLEKLQPHLQELFSQGVKPLVENLVHSELTKKGK